MTTLLICGVCRAARWVATINGDVVPWHGGEGTGTPCPMCNPGPEHYPWSMGCLDCVDWVTFAAENPGDPDVIVDELEASLL